MFHVNHEPGAEIHHTDPFAVPTGQRSPVRRLRGRLAAPVTLGRPRSGRADRLVDPGGRGGTGPAARADRPGVRPLRRRRGGGAVRRHAARAATPATRRPVRRPLPAPGGLFATGAWIETPYGPVPTDAARWAGCRLDTAREYGWGLLVEATIEAVDLAEEATPLLHYRGRYHELPA